MAWSCPCLTALSPGSPDTPRGAPGALRHNYYFMQSYFFQFSVCSSVTTQL